MAGSTGLEPATSGLTVQCANQAAPRARIYFSETCRNRLNHTTAHFAQNFALLDRSQLDRGLVEILLADDGVPAVDGLGLIAGPLHGDGAPHARALPPS